MPRFDAIDRRDALKAGLLFGSAGALVPLLARGQAPAELKSLRSTAKSWLWAAEDFAMGNGDYERNGLKIAATATGRGVNTDGLLSGATDVLLGAATQTMRVQILGRPVKMIAGMVNKYASHVVVKKALMDKAGVTEGSPVAQKVAVLKGLKLGTTGPGAAPDSLFRYLLGLGGLDPNRDCELVSIQGGGPAMLAGFERGVIDGFTLSSPTSDLAVQRFAGAYLFDMTRNPPAQLADYLYIAVSVTDRMMAEKTAQLQAYVKALGAALKVINDNPEAFKTWAKAFFSDMDAELFERSFASERSIYSKSPVVSEAQFRLNVEFLDRELKLLGQSGVPATFKYADAYDMRFAEAAARG
ncbi:MAG: ABC transporter substrate-binding protein [Alphaproteobacteria bacterium]|nr:ABC transporter substrate-binding protein [Alphaproteobacteria bacterium]